MSTALAYLNNDKDSFAYVSARERWPQIITKIIDDLHRAVATASDESHISQGKSLVAKVVELKHAIEHDRTLSKLPEDIDVYGPDTRYYNQYLDQLQSEFGGPVTWLSAPWLYSECYLYRKIACFAAESPLWKDHDYFYRQKEDTFRASSKGVYELAIRYSQLGPVLEEGVEDAALKALFEEFVDISLWGNATDLSLLTSLSLDAIQSLQGAEVRRQNEKNILVNDTTLAWEAVGAEPGGRIDFVLDNSGFELFTDLVFMLFLLDAKLCDRIVVHPKSLPWFVSDVMPEDFVQVLQNLKDDKFFPENRPALDALVDRLATYIDAGQLSLHVSSFWTSFAPFWEISHDGKYGGDLVRQDLAEAKLVIFKGDLNYRKLTGDRMWPKDTPFRTAIQALASSGVQLLALRTCKADVATGVSSEKEAELQQYWLKQGHDNKYGWVHHGKFALIQFSSGQTD